jgi:hypothetical protein
MKIIGTNIIFNKDESIENVDSKKFTYLGNFNEIVKIFQEHRVIPNSYIDYTDLTIPITDKTNSLLSWLKINQINTTDIIFTYANYKDYYLYINKPPKTAFRPNFKDLFIKIDDNLNDFVCNEFGNPIDFDGYNYYNLDNFNIIPNINYIIQGENNYIVKNTSININIGNLIGMIDKKVELYDYIKYNLIKII